MNMKGYYIHYFILPQVSRQLSARNTAFNRINVLILCSLKTWVTIKSNINIGELCRHVNYCRGIPD
jgi:hypothetical protein